MPQRQRKHKFQRTPKCSPTLLYTARYGVCKTGHQLRTRLRCIRACKVQPAVCVCVCVCYLGKEGVYMRVCVCVCVCAWGQRCIICDTCQGGREWGAQFPAPPPPPPLPHDVPHLPGQQRVTLKDCQGTH